MAEQQVERAMSGDESSESSENSTARDPRGDQDTLEDLKEYREINKEVNEDAIEELKSLTAQKETDSQRLAELRYTLEPTIKEIEVLDKKIQGMMKKLRLKRELINELKTCRAYHAKVKTLMQRAKEHEASNKKASLSGTTRQQEHRQGGRKESLSPPPLFHIGDDRTVTAFGMQRMPEPTGQIHRPEISATANTGQTFSRPDIFGMRMGNEDQGNPRTGWEWPTNTRTANAISHLLITEENYQPAVEALKQRYGQPALLRNSHLAALKEVEPVYNSKELTRLRRLHDEVDCHYKALTVMGVKSETYSMVIMPDLMKKIPRDIVVSVKRLRDVNYDWQLGEFLEGLWNELVIRGLHETNSNNREISKDHKTGKVFSIANKLCPFCLAEHPAEDCDKSDNVVRCGLKKIVDPTRYSTKQRLLKVTAWRMKYLESKKNHIWTRWMKEYILNLREYHKIITTIVDPPRLGQLVLIVDDSVRRRYWQMGKIVKQLKSKDGVTRAVKVQIASQGKVYEIERPLQGICPLEIDAPINKEKNDVSQLRIQPRRAAATSGENRR
eukprot:gene1352-1492_t